MRIKLEHLAKGYPPDACLQLLRLVAKHEAPGTASVSIINVPHNMTGKAWPDGRVELGLGPRFTLRPVVPTVASVRRLLPTVPCRDWRDAFVWLVAHELRHLTQYAQKPCCKRCAEQDAEEQAARALDRWRARTGRPPMLA